MYRTILAPLDGSTFAEQALPLATHITRAAGGVLWLVRVHVPVASAGSASDIDVDTKMKVAEDAYLHDVQTRVGSMCNFEAGTHLLDGRIADSLCEYARAAEADLVVMATHGRGPVSRWWLGSVANEVLHRSPSPLLLVRPEQTGPDLTRSPALRHVLIPLDGSKLAEGILEPAFELAELMQADVTLLRVIEPVILPDVRLGGNAASGINPGLLEALHEEARSYLDDKVELLRGRRPPVQIRIVSNRWSASAILEAAPDSGWLIALTTHGRSGLPRFLLGSVADKVIRGATVPVLVRRAPQQGPS
jgi:nucleotide-binding universal stress UspA family protein